MNTTVLAIQEEQVLVAVGKSGAKPSVQALYSAPAHGGGMENWERAVGALWQTHDLPTRGITLVLPDEAVATKTITAPSMPENKLEELVRHEMRPREDQLAAADYVPLGTDAEGRQQLFCAACRKETMAGYLAMADRLGLRLGSVTVPMAGRLRLLRAMPSLQSKTFVCLCFDSHILVNNTDSSLTCHGNCHTVFCNRIHAGAHHRDVQLDLLGQMRSQIYHVWGYFRILRNQKHIIEGNTITNNCTHFLIFLSS